MINLKPLYKNSILYTKLKKEPIVFERICSSFENFIDYLNDDKVIIDYTYLWDIICTPNDKLFKDGINMVILNIPKNDTTNDINIICPTNHYSSQFYNPKKPTLILIHEDDYFEPIYSYREEIIRNEKQIFIGKLFKEEDAKLSKGVRFFFDKVVKPFYKKQCIPFASMPTKYKMKTPLLLPILMERLNENGYSILLQVMNFQEKVVGVIVEYIAGNERMSSSSGFVPCYPSSPDPKIDYEYMIESNLWSNYPTTISFLVTLYNRSKGKIPCKPVFKIVEDEIVVGILTETNQFINISEPLPVSEINDDIPEMRDTNYMITENDIINEKGKKDDKRVEYIQKIKLETRFYQTFRNTIRMLLNDYKYLKLREQIEEIVNTPFIIYQGKLEQTSKLLKILVIESIIFVDDYDYTLIKEVTTCLNKEKDKCLAESPLCTLSNNTTCQMVLPKQNLITGANNERNYFLKMADELIRYSRIKSFIFEPQVYLSFSPIDYHLRDDEIIIMQSLITQEYFRGLIPAVVNPYVRF